ncbi:uncharacterized protein J3D65DRAFT_663700 [Phyllosticta citribraziliensis]|uniref:Uncharacterized protein n=1 Tax=Phyllosticta citribraziliensis TaxID=989973 RepID=A0ABR1M9B5_9PEZI
MPMNWNADADARLLVGIVNYTDFKLNKETLAKLNTWMGPDCVGQSISQRLIKLKKKFYDDHPELVGTTLSGAGSEADLKTPKSASKGNKRKTADADDASADADDTGVTPTPKKRARRPKKVATPGASEENGEDGTVPPTPTPKKRGRPKKSEVEAAKLAKDTEQAAIKEEDPGSDKEDRADSVMNNAGDELLAAAVGQADGEADTDQENLKPKASQGESDCEA